MDTDTKIIKSYLLMVSSLTMGAVVCVLILRGLGLKVYDTNLGFIFIAMVGTASAISGITVAKKLKMVSSYKQILKDFFNIFQPLSGYLLVIMFLLIQFGIPLFKQDFIEPPTIKMLFSYFVTALLFGGIEEIGWRYVFQPTLEKKVNFVLATVITSICWCIWHLLYFFVDGSLFTESYIDIISLICNIIGIGFALGAVYRINKSLWLCVFLHVMMNVIVRSINPMSFFYTVVATLILIVVSISVVHIVSKKREHLTNISA